MKKLLYILLLACPSLEIFGQSEIFHNLISHPAAPRDIIGIIGDSNADGRGETIPTVPGNTLYLWNGSSFSQITTQTVANDSTVWGSIWQQMAIDYKALTTNPVYLVNGASGSSEFYPNGDNNNWSTTGTLYAAFKSEMDEALLNSNVPDPKYIIINLGINDLRSEIPTVNIIAGMNSLLDRIETDYPTATILFIGTGRTESGKLFNDEAHYLIRSEFLNQSIIRDNVYVVCMAVQFRSITGMYKSDLLHYSQTMNNTIGSMIVRWIDNDHITNKKARRVISSQFDVLNANRESLIVDFINHQDSIGNWEMLENLHLFRNSTQNNTRIDLTGRGDAGLYLGSTTPVFVANSHISTNGTTAYFGTPYVNEWYKDGGGDGNDFISGVRLLSRTTADGTSASLFGRTGSSSVLIRVAQSSSSNINYNANVTIANLKTYTGDTGLQDSTLHSVARNGTTEYYIKNTTIVDSNVLASSGTVDVIKIVGAAGSAATVIGFLNGTYLYTFDAKYVGFDLTEFYDGMEYVMDHWND